MKHSIRKSLSLVEVLVAVAIFAVLSVSFYSFLRTGMLMRKRLESGDYYSLNMYLKLDMVAQELRNSVFFKTGDSGFKGSKQVVEFFTPIYDYSQRKYKFLNVKYYLQEGSLIKVVKDPFNPEYIRETVFLGDVESLSFSYFDRNKKAWSEEWLDNQAFPFSMSLRIKRRGLKNSNEMVSKHIRLGKGL